MLVCEVTMNNFDDSVALRRAAENEQRKAERARDAGLPQFAVYHDAQARRLRDASGLRTGEHRFSRQTPVPDCITPKGRDWTPTIVCAIVLAAGFLTGAFGTNLLVTLAEHLRRVLP
jgi:hypothetical protein